MIHVISTSANVEKNYDARKIQYLNGVASIKTHYQIDPYIIECHGKTDYLSEHYVGHSNYSDNKGVNELVNIENFLILFANKFHDEDHVIKTTLRYQVTSACLLDHMATTDHEIYCKRSTDIYGGGDPGVHTFLFSMKYRCWRDFLLNYFDRAVGPYAPIEHQIAAYVQTRDTCYLSKLGMLAAPNDLNKTHDV